MYITTQPIHATYSSVRQGLVLALSEEGNAESVKRYSEIPLSGVAHYTGYSQMTPAERRVHQAIRRAFRYNRDLAVVHSRSGRVVLLTPERPIKIGREWSGKDVSALLAKSPKRELKQFPILPFTK
jgi:hypothetical protein